MTGLMRAPIMAARLLAPAGCSQSFVTLNGSFKLYSFVAPLLGEGSISFPAAQCWISRTGFFPSQSLDASATISIIRYIAGSSTSEISMYIGSPAA